MSPQDVLDEQKLNLLKAQIKSSLEDTWGKYTRYNQLDIALILIAIALSAVVTFLGFIDQGFWAGVGGLVLTTLLSVQKVFNTSEKANFYRTMHMQTKSLRDRLTYKVSSEEDLQAIVDAFMSLREQRISSNPRRRDWEEAGSSNNSGREL
jgi:ABC-type transport system involved in cytochrome bd biosynthesis fused ATPase/permease subunit